MLSAICPLKFHLKKESIYISLWIFFRRTETSGNLSLRGGPILMPDHTNADFPSSKVTVISNDLPRGFVGLSSTLMSGNSSRMPSVTSTAFRLYTRQDLLKPWPFFLFLTGSASAASLDSGAFLRVEERVPAMLPLFLWILNTPQKPHSV